MVSVTGPQTTSAGPCERVSWAAPVKSNRVARIVVLASGVYLLLVSLVAAAMATGYSTLLTVGCLVLGMMFIRESRRGEYR